MSKPSENLKIVAAYLNAATTELQQVVTMFTDMIAQHPIEEVIEVFFYLRDLKDIGKDIEKVANLGLPIVSSVVGENVSASGFESVKVLHEGQVFTVKPDTKARISVSAANKPALIELMRQDPEACESIREDVHPKHIESFVVKWMESGKELPDFISMYLEPTLNVRKSK